MKEREYRVRVKRTRPSTTFSGWFEEITFRVTAATKMEAATLAVTILETHHIFKERGLEMTVETVE